MLRGMDLPAHLAQRLRHAPGAALVVGYSGGMDSSVLLQALAGMPQARARGLRALHVDHRLHADSAAWADHCREVAAALDVPLRIAVVHVERHAGTGLEDAARRARHAAFAAELSAGEVLVLAQHRGDQAETVLLKLLRGAGPEGLGAMREWRACGSGLLWRPLLDVPRADLQAYAHAHRLRWIEDPGNAGTAQARNFLRHEILPRLAQHWPQAEAALAHSARWQACSAAFIESHVVLALTQLQGPQPHQLDWRGWLALPDALRDPVLRRWLRACALDEPAHFHVLELERQLRAAADRHPALAFGNACLRRVRQHLVATRRAAAPPMH